MKARLTALCVISVCLTTTYIAGADEPTRCENFENRAANLSYSVCSSGWAYGEQARLAATYCPADYQYAYAHICETGWQTELAPAVEKTTFPPAAIKHVQFACVIHNFTGLKNDPDFDSLQLRSRLVCSDRVIKHSDRELLGSLLGLEN